MESKSKSKFSETSISYVRFRQKLLLKSQQILSELFVPVELYIPTASQVAKGRHVGKVDILRKFPFFWKHGPWAHSPLQEQNFSNDSEKLPRRRYNFPRPVLFSSFFLRIFCVGSIVCINMFQLVTHSRLFRASTF